MPLITNGLFLDEKYKLDCETKINYLDLENDENISESVNNDEYFVKITEGKYKIFKATQEIGEETQ